MWWRRSRRSGAVTVLEDPPVGGYGAASTPAPDAPLRVRPAAPADAQDLLRWRNDPLARAMSRNQAPILEEAHSAWYTAACRDPDSMLLIGCVGERPVGMVRFDRRPPSAWEASILLAPQARGRGLGRPLLESALGRLEALRGPTVVLAQVRDSNTASIRLFESLGFVRCGSDLGFLRYRRPGAE